MGKGKEMDSLVLVDCESVGDSFRKCVSDIRLHSRYGSKHSCHELYDAAAECERRKTTSEFGLGHDNVRNSETAYPLLAKKDDVPAVLVDCNLVASSFKGYKQEVRVYGNPTVSRDQLYPVVEECERKKFSLVKTLKNNKAAIGNELNNKF